MQAVTITKTQGANMKGEPTNTGTVDLRCFRYVISSMPFK